MLDPLAYSTLYTNDVCVANEWAVQTSNFMNVNWICTFPWHTFKWRLLVSVDYSSAATNWILPVRKKKRN